MTLLNCKKKDLVLCAAIDLNLDQIKLFFNSFRRFNREAEIFCLVESDLSQDKNNFLFKNKVNLLFCDCLRFIPTKHNNTRYLKIQEFIAQNSNCYKNVLLSDVRDVVFQKDPFSDLSGEFIIAPEEDEEKTIEMDQQFNARWLKQCYGENFYEEFKDRKIICCGTVIGSIKNITVYLEHICQEMYRFYEEKSECFYDMMDTAIHVSMFYKKYDLFLNPIIKTNGDYIATIGITSREYPHKIEVLNNHILVNGKMPSIVHQYDRSEPLIQYYNIIENRFKENLFDCDNRFETYIYEQITSQNIFL
jgi:hypothetical protein